MLQETKSRQNYKRLRLLLSSIFWATTVCASWLMMHLKDTLNGQGYIPKSKYIFISKLYLYFYWFSQYSPCKSFHLTRKCRTKHNCLSIWANIFNYPHDLESENVYFRTKLTIHSKSNFSGKRNSDKTIKISLPVVQTPCQTSDLLHLTQCNSHASSLLLYLELRKLC